MRPFKFMLALLFGAAVIITFLKLLFFAVVVAAVGGTLFAAFRAGRVAEAWRGSGGQPQFLSGNAQPFSLSAPSNAMSLGRQPMQFAENQRVARSIEVL